MSLRGSSAVALVCLALTTACTPSESREEAQSDVAGITIPATPPPQNARYLYHRFSQRLLTYDVEQHRVEEISDAPNFFQYEFPTPSRLFTAGDSVKGGFSILQVSPRKVTDVLTMPDDEGVFPLATSDRATFFLRSTYDAKGRETRRELVRLDAGKRLVPFTSVSGLVDSGAIVKDRLYYSVFDEEHDSYDVWSVPVAEPRREMKDLDSGRLYAHDGALWHADARSIVRDDRSFECADLCYFHDEKRILIRIRVNQDSELDLDVIDTDTGKLIGSVADGLDYRVGDERVTVFREGDAQHVSLPR